MHKFTKKYIIPKEKDPDLRARIIVLNWLLIGSILLVGAAFLIDSYNLLVQQRAELLPILAFLAIIFATFTALYKCVRAEKFVRTISLGIVLLFGLLGLWVLAQWGIINPIGLLVLSLCIVTASILLGATQALSCASILSVAVIVLYFVHNQHIVQADMSWIYLPIRLTDAISFVILFFIIALVSWLFNRQMEHSLQRAQRSEAALKRQKALLEVRVDERTRELEQLQIEKMQQFYRFAELGRLSTSLFHDLANHLTTMNIDLEGLGKNDKSKMMQRIQQNASYIDDVIRRVREQLLGKEESEKFVLYTEIKEIIQILTPKAKQANIHLIVHVAAIHKKVAIDGSLTRFRQMVINLLSNAIDSYDGVERSEKPVTLSIAQNKLSVAIVVKDEGCGIPPEVQQNIFKPFYSTKHSGVGIGLFIVKQITEQYFNGKLSFVSSENIGTTFTIKLPKNIHEPPKKG